MEKIRITDVYLEFPISAVPALFPDYLADYVEGIYSSVDPDFSYSNEDYIIRIQNNKLEIGRRDGVFTIGGQKK